MAATDTACDPETEIIIGPDDIVIGENQDGDVKQIDLSILNRDTPVYKSLANRTVRQGEVIPITRGEERLWEFTVIETLSKTP